MVYSSIWKKASKQNQRRLLMGYTIRQIPEEHKWSYEFRLDVLEAVLPEQGVREVLSEEQAWEKREKKLSMYSVIYLIIALAFYPSLGQAGVWRKVAAGLRFLWPDPEVPLAGEAALCYRREQLGGKPLRRLFERVCQPMATPETPGAFRLGRRVMAVDSTLEDVASTEANAAFFGYHCRGKTRSPFPQVRCSYLLECGTHAFVDAVLSPCRPHEQRWLPQLLPQVQRDMLVTFDRGLYSAEWMQGLRSRGAHGVGRLKAGMLCQGCYELSDGSYLVAVFPKNAPRKGQPLLLRVIEYTFNDPAVPGAGQIHRLVTTLLNPRTAPALALILLYHERWEIESTIDELDTHQRLCAHTLRSKTPQGVQQELYGLLLAHYAVRFFMHQAALLDEPLDPDRLSFTHSLSIIENGIREFTQVVPHQRRALTERLLRDVRAHVLPPRRLRCNPRVVKRRFSKFPKKRPAHLHIPDLKKPFEEMILLI